MFVSVNIRQLVRPLAVVLLLLPLSGCDYFSSFESVCEKRLPLAKVEVIGEDIDVKTDFTRSIEQLSATGAATVGRMVLGLVETKLTGAVEFTAPGIVKPLSGRYCMRPSLKLTLAFKPTSLYVAREHAAGSCEFDITMDHEKKHIAVYQKYLDQMALDVRDELREKLGDSIQYFDSAEAGETSIRQRAATILQPFLERGAVESAKRQALVDTPEEYFRLETFQARCSPRESRPPSSG